MLNALRTAGFDQMMMTGVYLKGGLLLSAAKQSAQQSAQSTRFLLFFLPLACFLGLLKLYQKQLLS